MIRDSVRTVVLASLVMSVTACGGGGDGGDRLSREELIEEGDAICAEYESRMDELGEPATADEFPRYVEEAKRIAEERTDALDDLRPPEELEEDYDKWIELTREGIAGLVALEAARAEGDEQRMQDLAQSFRAKDAQADRIAQNIGLQECGGDET